MAATAVWRFAEKSMSHMRPPGGDGGKGGDVIMESNERHNEVTANGQEAEISSKESA